MEQLEAELETGKVELRLRDEDRQRAEKLSEELDSLKVRFCLLNSNIPSQSKYATRSNVTMLTP